MKKLATVIVVLLSLTVLPLVGLSQITIAPTNVFLSQQRPFDSYLVINGSDKPQEISVSFVFGYNIVDSTGNRFPVYEDSVRAEEYSAAQWVTAFPRSFTLAPGERQTVRLRVQPPNPTALIEKLYWARVKTLAVPLSPPVEAQSEDEVSAQINFELEQVTGLFYKVGNPQSGIEIQNFSTALTEAGNLELIADLERTGNAPYIGTIYFDILNQNNQSVRSSSLSTTIHFDETLRQILDINGLEPGSYRAQIRFTNQRPDISQANLVQMNPASKTIGFRIN